MSKFVKFATWLESKTRLPEHLYHGGDQAFTTFQYQPGIPKRGFYFTPSFSIARNWALLESKDGFVKSVRLTAQNPKAIASHSKLLSLRMTMGEEETIRMFQDQGFDSIVIDDPRNNEIEYVVFDPKHIQILKKTEVSKARSLKEDEDIARSSGLL